MCPAEGRESEGRTAPGFSGKIVVSDAEPLAGRGGGPFPPRRPLSDQRLCTHTPSTERNGPLPFFYFSCFFHQRKFQIFTFPSLAQVARGLPTRDPNPRGGLDLRCSPSPSDEGPGRCPERPSLTVFTRDSLPSTCPVLPGCPRACVSLLSIPGKPTTYLWVSAMVY